MRQKIREAIGNLIISSLGSGPRRLQDALPTDPSEVKSRDAMRERRDYCRRLIADALYVQLDANVEGQGDLHQLIDDELQGYINLIVAHRGREVVKP